MSLTLKDEADQHPGATAMQGSNQTKLSSTTCCEVPVWCPRARKVETSALMLGSGCVRLQIRNDRAGPCTVRCNNIGQQQVANYRHHWCVVVCMRVYPTLRSKVLPCCQRPSAQGQACRCRCSKRIEAPQRRNFVKHGHGVCTCAWSSHAQCTRCCVASTRLGHKLRPA